MSDKPPPPVVDLNLHRLKLKQEQLANDKADLDLDGNPLAYVEAIWGHSVYGYNAYTVDMEAYRRGTPSEQRDLLLRVPETDYEKELLIRHIRALANDLALQFGRADLIDGNSLNKDDTEDNL